VKVQKELLTREQALYDTLLGHWRNSTGLVTPEHGVNNLDVDLDDNEDPSDPDYLLECSDYDVEPGPSRKKSKSSLRRTRNSYRTTLKQNQDINGNGMWYDHRRTNK